MILARPLRLWLRRNSKLLGLMLACIFHFSIYASTSAATNAFKNTFKNSGPEELLAFRHLIQNPSDQSELGKIRAIEQDSDGNIWLAGISNLARFDGVELTYFKRDPADPSSLATNSVAALLRDQDGVLWLSSEQALQIYVPEHENFVMIASVKQGAESARYISMARSGEKTLWLLGPDEVAKVNIHTHEISSIWNTATPNSPLYQKKLRLVFEDAQQRVWIATDNSEIFVFDAQGNLLKQLLHNYRGLPSVTNIDITQDRNNNIWVSGRGAGAAKISADLNHITTYLSDNTPGSLPSDDVAGIAQDGRGRIWLAVDHQGLTLFDETTQRFRVLPHSPYDLLSPATNQPQQLFVDRAGDLWVEHNTNGVDYLLGVDLALARYRNAPLQASSISNNAITSLLQDRNQRIWVGTESGLNLLNSESQQFHRLALAGSDSTILSLAEIDGGGVWVGTQSDGLFQVDGDGKTVRKFDETHGLEVGGILSLASDSSGDIWIGSQNRGLVKLSPTQVKFEHYTHQTNNPNSISDDTVQSILTLNNNTFLVGTAFGLNQFNPKTEKFFRVDTDRRFFKSHDIRSLLKQKNGRIWVSTKGGGITVLDQDLRPIQHLGVSQGLPSETVSGLAEDDIGMIWALTSNGVAYINSTTLEMTILKREQGLTSNYFNRNAVMVDNQGFAYLGSVDGLSVVMRPSLKPSLPASAALINKLYLFNHEIAPNSPSSPLATAMTATEKLTLDYHASLIGVGFSTINLRGGDSVRFRYQLEGIDKTWVTATPERRATYASLPSGVYTFKVQAGDQNEFWESSEDRLILTVLPPPWLTTQAKAAYGFVAASAIWMLGGFLSLNLKRRRAEFLLKTKTDFLSLLSHEIRTPLAGIIGMLGLALKEDSVESRTRKKIELGYQNAQTLLTIANDILHINSAGEKSIDHEDLYCQSESKSHERKLNILCAEDFDTNQIIIRQFIEDMGHDLTIVENGLEALEILSTRKFDLILMDQRMPKMDGNEASAIIRSGLWDERIIDQKDIPIVALTANMTKADIDSYWAVGVDAIVGKPIDRDELFRVIQNIIRRDQQAKATHEQFPKGSNGGITAPSTESDLDAMFGVTPPQDNSTMGGGGP